MDLGFNNILKKGINAFLVQGISMVLLFVLNWYLAKELGASDYGVFTYSMSWVYLLGTLSILGLDGVLQRELIKYAPEKIKGLIRFSRLNNLAISLMVTFIFGVTIYLISPELEKGEYYPLLIAILALPLFSQLLLNKSICVGLKQVVKSQLPDDIIRPLLTLLLCIVFFRVFAPSVELTLFAVIGSISVAAIVSWVLVGLVKPTRKIQIDKSERPVWIKLGLSFFVLTAATTINGRADILMLGLFDKTDQAGIYNIATKLSALIGLSLLLINKVLAPFISEHFETGKDKLSSIIKKLMRIFFVFGALIFAVYFFFGEHILVLFGLEFKAGYWPLVVLSAGQILNIALGPVGNLLTMSKFEKASVNIMIFSTLINIILNFSLIPIYGMMGAAIGTSASLFLWNIIHYFYVRKRLMIDPTIF